ncbi:MAG: bifunctional (p)ppGpp synthetase/guanosine-3',5'-bis(diphosphate) 3'-pyrophosphohydrolase [Bacteroidota bacterium]
MPEKNTIQLDAEKKQILKEYRHLLRSLKPKIKNSSDKADIRRSFEMAVEAHKTMRRKSGEPYIHHPLAVAQIVVDEIGLGTESAICALLHDTVEDTDLTLEDIEMNFDKQTSKIIDGLTKISGAFELNMDTSQQAENFRKLLLTLTDDIRVILIKIADRLHNMRTMESMAAHKQMKIASETLFIYAPLAHRLGLYNIKSELEDLSLKYTQPEIYKDISQKLADSKKERSKYINEFISPLKDLLNDKGYNFEIYGRPKSIYSIYNKIKTKHVPFEEIYDLFAIRIIVDTEIEKEKSECWGVYSVITDLYTPSTERLRDWISNPKANGYEALHTTVMGPQGRWVEVQIRSKRMHEIAEMGVAAHWKYKENTTDNALDEWLEKIRETIQNPDTNALEFVTNFRQELFSEEIFVFTPKGLLKRLKAGATALDFAFEIHSELGLKCIGAKINHKLVPLSHKLQNGDQIEILTSNKQQPNEDWLKFVVTSKAISVLRKTLQESKKKMSELGKDTFEKKLKQFGIPHTDHNINVAVKFYKYLSPFDLYFYIQTKNLTLTDLKDLKIQGGKLMLPTTKIESKETIEETVKKELKKNAELLIMGESSNQIAYKFANCCNPIPGDDVFGFITIGEGIKIHRTNCPNAVQLMSKYDYRIVRTKWNKQQEIAFLTGVKLNGIDDVGVINKLTNIITGQLKLNMRSISFDTDDGIFEGKIMVYVHNIEQLDKLIDELSKQQGIFSVSRIDESEMKN